MISAQEALIYTMVVAAESDHDVADVEIDIIGDLVHHLPVFHGLDRAAMARIATLCSEMLAQTGGSDRVFDQIREALSPDLRETAYALACDVIAVDSRLNRDELQVLEQIRVELEVAPGIARTIERVAQVRFQAA